MRLWKTNLFLYLYRDNECYNCASGQTNNKNKNGKKEN